MTKNAASGAGLCLLEHRDGKPRAATRGLLDGGCYQRLERTIAELPSALNWIGHHLAAGSVQGGEKISRGRQESRPPIRVDVHDALVDVPEKLTSWCLLVCEERDLRGPKSTPEALAVFLVAHLDWIAAQLWVDAMAVELFEASRDLYVLAPWKPGRHRLREPCPAAGCDVRALVRWDGDSVVKCEACGAVWSETDYERLMHILAVEDGRRSA